MVSPNIFKYASKELSQDAVICWLLEWAGQTKQEIYDDEENEELRNCGLRFVRAILRGVRLGREVQMRVFNQVKYIDVLAHINERHVLLIESKTKSMVRETESDSKAPKNQLVRYFEAVRDGNLPKRTEIPRTPKENIHCVYVKTGNISLWERDFVVENNYVVFNRIDFLKVLRPYRGTNDILLDFRFHLEQIHQKTKSFKRWTRSMLKPKDLGWEGLYEFIELHYEENERVKWFPLSSMKGGYNGLWMQPEVTSKDSRFNLWITENTISFRLCGAKVKEISPQGMDRSKTRWAKAFKDHGQGILTHPRRGLIATTSKPMCVAEWRGWLEFNKRGKLDLGCSVRNINKALRMLRKTIINGPR